MVVRQTHWKPGGLMHLQRLIQHCPPNPQPHSRLNPGQVAPLEASEDPMPEPVFGDRLSTRRPAHVLALRSSPLHACLHPFGERLLLQLCPGDGDVEGVLVRNVSPAAIC
jgi:hypothetical protein